MTDEKAPKPVGARAATLLTPNVAYADAREGLQELGRELARAAMRRAERRQSQTDARLLLARLAAF